MAGQALGSLLPGTQSGAVCQAPSHAGVTNVLNTAKQVPAQLVLYGGLAHAFSKAFSPSLRTAGQELSRNLEAEAEAENMEKCGVLVAQIEFLYNLESCGQGWPDPQWRGPSHINHSF